MSGKSCTDQPYKELYAAEIQALRGEINSAVDRINGNENFSTVTISGIYAFILTNNITLISLILSVISLIVVCIGAWRYHELICHVRKLDTYLISIEGMFGSKGGWTASYYTSQNEVSQTAGSQEIHIIDNAKQKAKDAKKYPASRILFWGALFLVSVGGLVYISLVWLECLSLLHSVK